MLAKLNPNEGDLSVKHLGGVWRPAPSAGAFQGGVQQTTAQHQNERGGPHAAAPCAPLHPRGDHRSRHRSRVSRTGGQLAPEPEVTPARPLDQGTPHGPGQPVLDQ